MATNLPKKIIDALPKQFSYTRQMSLGEPPRPIVPENATPIRSTEMGRNIIGYEIPLEKPADYPETDALGFPVPPLVAKYDVNGKLLKITSQQRYFADNEYHIQPEYSATGEFITDSASTNAANSGSLFGDITRDLGPIILAALAGNAAAGNLSGLFGGGGAGAAASTAGAGAAAGGAGAAGGFMGSALPAGAGAGGFFAPGVTAGAATLGIPTMTGAPAGVTAGIPSGAAAPAASAAAAPAAASTIPAAASVAGTAAGAGAGTGVTSSVLSAISSATGIDLDTLKTFAPSVIQGLIGAGGSYLQSEQAKEAAQTQADAQIRAAQIAADAARFRPVGVTTRFGSSNFTTDAAGNVTGAGYTPSAEITGYQDRLRTLAGQGMTDIEGARTAYQPLTGAAQSLFGLGQGYLAKTPEQAAQDYISKQQALLTPSRENQLAELRNRQFQTGRSGAAVSQGGNLMNTNPELAAYYNSLAQQDLVLAANADQEARNRITYGAGLFDTGANLQGRFYTGQTAAYSPFTTAMDTSSGLDRLAREPLDLSTAIGSQVSTANANVGRLTGQGIINAAGTMAPANAYSGTGNLLAGAANSPNVTRGLENIFGSTPNPPAQVRNIYTGELVDAYAPYSQPRTFGNMTIDPVTGRYVPVR